MTISQDAHAPLMAYPWPGNVRQLENAIERALAFTMGRAQIDVTDLTPEIQNQPARPLIRRSSGFLRWARLRALHRGVELSLIRRSLERTQGNKRQAAKLLNLKRTTLIEKLKTARTAAAPKV